VGSPPWVCAVDLAIAPGHMAGQAVAHERPPRAERSAQAAARPRPNRVCYLVFARAFPAADETPCRLVPRTAVGCHLIFSAMRSPAGVSRTL